MASAFPSRLPSWVLPTPPSRSLGRATQQPPDGNELLSAYRVPGFPRCFSCCGAFNPYRRLVRWVLLSALQFWELRFSRVKCPAQGHMPGRLQNRRLVWGFGLEPVSLTVTPPGAVSSAANRSSELEAALGLCRVGRTEEGGGRREGADSPYEATLGFMCQMV